mmetsp:Transcript_64640/g.151924  ORF Transcript_64640/g.151924 Transcript_64640/m.151924 type:complete len:605 (+) Transcript_64640:84-1898(+)
MIQVFRYGIDIARHHLKGIYVVTVGQIRKPSPDETEDRISRPSGTEQQVICTLREGSEEECEDWNDCSADGKAQSGSPKYSPITFTYRGQKTTLRPWDPSRCPLAAAIHNRLVHFPIRPKSNVFAILCSLQSLSHISDTLGPLGRIIGVLSPDPAKRPNADTIRRFLKRHPTTTLIFEDPEEATLERYERLLSLPQDSRYAFLMALHPRLGEKSPARLLKEDAPKLCGRIFDFLVCNTPAHIKSLVLWPCTGGDSKQGRDEDAEVFDKVPRQVQDIVMNHTDILQRWRRPKKPGDKKPSEGENSDSHERIWVFLDICTDTSSGGNLDMELVNELAKIGLLAKEQLALTPWFPNRALLLLQYALHRDERQMLSYESYHVPGIEARERRLVKEERTRSKEKASHRPPSAVSMPVPSFGTSKPVQKPSSSSAVPLSAPVSGGGCGGGGCNDFNASFLPDPAGGLPQHSQMMGKGAYMGPPGLAMQAGGRVPNWLGEEPSQQELLSLLQARQAVQGGPPTGQWPPGLGSGFPEAATQSPWQQQVAMFQHGGMGQPCGQGFPMGKGGSMPALQARQMGAGHPMNPGNPGQAQMFGNFREDQLGHRAVNL